MSYMTACQPGWLAVFADANSTDGFSTEPIACWLLESKDGEPTVKPICAMGRDMCDATVAANYVGVAAPGVKPETVFKTAHVPLPRSA